MNISSNLFDGMVTNGVIVTLLFFFIETEGPTSI